ncbi:unnamed protein product [Gadus morhua 'NCC']
MSPDGVLVAVNPQLCGSGVECEEVVKRGGGSSYRRSAGCFSTPRNTLVITLKRETQLPPYPSPPALPRGPDSGIQSHDPIHPQSSSNHGTLLLPYLVMDVSLSLHLAPICSIYTVLMLAGARGRCGVMVMDVCSGVIPLRPVRNEPCSASPSPLLMDDKLKAAAAVPGLPVHNASGFQGQGRSHSCYSIGSQWL